MRKYENVLSQEIQLLIKELLHVTIIARKNLKINKISTKSITNKKYFRQLPIYFAFVLREIILYSLGGIIRIAETMNNNKVTQLKELKYHICAKIL
jgi:hypothetical protein